jgi:hypothetical protein
MTAKRMAVNSSRGWRRLPPADLETLVLQVRRSSVNRHLSVGEWRELDRMRARLASLHKERTQ